MTASKTRTANKRIRRFIKFKLRLQIKTAAEENTKMKSTSKVIRCGRKIMLFLVNKTWRVRQKVKGLKSAGHQSK